MHDAHVIMCHGGACGITGCVAEERRPMLQRADSQLVPGGAARAFHGCCVNLVEIWSGMRV